MDYHKIINHLFIGNNIIPTHDFFHMIVNCTHETPFSIFCNLRVRIPVNDDIDDCGKFIQLISKTNVLQKIHNCITLNQNVLVHCFGSENQRSFAIIACYLIKYYTYTPIQAVNFIFEKSDIYFEKIIFIKSIVAYYYSCKRKCDVILLPKN